MDSSLGEGLETPTVLVVDDESVVRELIVRALEGNGLRVLTAASASEAMAAAAGARIDLLLADLSLPDLSGPALAAKLHAEQPAARVLYVSGWHDREAFPEMGDAPLLTKPFTFEGLRQAVAQALDVAQPGDPLRPVA